MYCTCPQYVFLQNYKYTINCVSTLISKLFCASATLIRKLEMKTLSCLFFNLIAYLNYKHTCIHTYNIYLQTLIHKKNADICTYINSYKLELSFFSFARFSIHTYYNICICAYQCLKTAKTKQEI